MSVNNVGSGSAGDSEISLVVDSSPCGLFKRCLLRHAVFELAELPAGVRQVQVSPRREERVKVHSRITHPMPLEGCSQVHRDSDDLRELLFMSQEFRIGRLVLYVQDLRKQQFVCAF